MNAFKHIEARAKPEEKPIIIKLIDNLSLEEESIDKESKKVDKNLNYSSEGFLLEEEKWRIDPSLIKEGHLIGHGMFGKVFKAEYNGTTVALKKLSLDFAQNKNVQEDFKREIKILATLRRNL